MWYRLIGLVGRVFANSLGDLSSIPGRVIPKTLKMLLDTSLLNTQQCKVGIKGKVEQSGEGVAPSPTPRCSSYWKGSLRVALDNGRQLHFIIICYLKPYHCVPTNDYYQIEIITRIKKKTLYRLTGSADRLFANGPGDRIQSLVESYKILNVTWYLLD